MSHSLEWIHDNVHIFPQEEMRHLFVQAFEKENWLKEILIVLQHLEGALDEALVATSSTTNDQPEASTDPNAGSRGVRRSPRKKSTAPDVKKAVLGPTSDSNLRRKYKLRQTVAGLPNIDDSAHGRDEDGDSIWENLLATKHHIQHAASALGKALHEIDPGKMDVEVVGQ